MKKQLLLLVCLLSFSISQAQTFNDGVLEYTVTSGTNVSVKKFNNVCPTGTLTIPNTVTDNSITYTITEIENQAFYNCSGLTSLSIPNSVTAIGAAAFSDCTGLMYLSIPNSVTSIGNFAFRSCIGLTSLSIPNSVTAIGYGTFAYCGSLTSLSILNSVTSIGNLAFSGCYSLTSLSIPNSVTSIGDYAFYACSGLTSLSISNSVTSIGHGTFSGCYGLTSLSIPNSVTAIGDEAFNGCSGLTSVTVGWATPLVVPTNVFNNVNVSAIPLTVPAGTVALYQAAAVWQDFGSFVLSTENFTENNINVALFPNPVNNTLNIALDTAISKVAIYNLQGQKVKESTTEQVNVATLSQGIYLIKIEDENGNTAMKKFIKK